MKRNRFTLEGGASCRPVACRSKRSGYACENTVAHLILFARFMTRFGKDNDNSRAREHVQKMFRFF
ncbi:MAG: hypothetical protein ACLP5H_16835 [Desulfomonilaceae bacterium]